MHTLYVQIRTTDAGQQTKPPHGMRSGVVRILSSPHPHVPSAWMMRCCDGDDDARADHMDSVHLTHTHHHTCVNREFERKLVLFVLPISAIARNSGPRVFDVNDSGRFSVAA